MRHGQSLGAVRMDLNENFLSKRINIRGYDPSKKKRSKIIIDEPLKTLWIVVHKLFFFFFGFTFLNCSS